MGGYVPKVGDKVKVTLEEATVLAVNNEPYAILGPDTFDLTVQAMDTGADRKFHVSARSGKGADRTVTVELVKPAAPVWPTTPGSVIGYKYSEDSRYVRLASGAWQSVNYPDETSADDQFSADWYEVLFDAGKGA